MKVLHLTKTFPPYTHGGIEESVRQICLALTPYGVQSDVLSLTEQESHHLQYDGINVMFFKQSFRVLSTPFSWELLFKIQKIVAQYDIIHCHFPWPYCDLLYMLHSFKQRTVISYQCESIYPKYPLLQKAYTVFQQYYLKKANKIIVSSPNMLESNDVLKKLREKISIIPIGLDPKSYSEPTVDNLRLWQKRFPKPFILFLGMLRHYKGLEYLLQTAKNIKGDIVIAGEGSEKAMLETMINAQKLTNVHLVGRVTNEDKSALLKLCHAIVLPSTLRSEAFGVALLEAAMFKKPLISTELGTGTSYVNENNVTGFVVPPCDSQALGERMNILLTDTALATQMGQKAYERFQALFLMEKISRQYLELYRGIL